MLQSNRLNTIIPLLFILIGSVFSVGIGIMSLEAPILLLIAFTIGVVGIFSLSYPNLATQFFVFVLYTNAAVVANKFHGVPFVVAAAYPAMLFVPFTYLMVIRKEKIIFNRQLFLMGGLFVVQAVGTIISVRTAVAFEILLTYVIEAILIYALTLNVIRSERQLKGIIAVTFLATIFLGFFPTVQYITGTEDNNYFGFAQISESYGFTVSETLTTTVAQSRYAGAIGEKNRFAQVMFMLMMIALPHAIMKGGSTSWRLFALAAVASAAFASTLAFSRGGAVGVAMAIAIGVLFRVFSWKHLAMLGLAITLVFAAVPQYFVRLTSLSSVTSVGTIFGFESAGGVSYEEPDGAIQGRLTQMIAAGIVYAENPIVGVGPGMFKFYAQDVGNQLGIRRLDSNRRSHNLYLDILSNTGTLGFLFIMGVIYYTQRDLLKVHRRLKEINPFLSNTALGFFLSIITYMTTGIFLHFAYIRYFWLTMAIAACTARIGMYLVEQMEKKKNGSDSESDDPDVMLQLA